MEWYVYALCGLGGAVFGLTGAYVNMLISRAGVKSDNFAGVMGVNMLRMLVNIIVLLVCIFVCRSFKLPLVLTVLAAAMGLSVGGMLFLKRLTKEIQSQSDAAADGGE